MVVDEASPRVTSTHNPLGVSTQRVSGHANLERKGTRRVTRWWLRSDQEAGRCSRPSYNDLCDLVRLVPLAYLLPIITSTAIFFLEAVLEPIRSPCARPADLLLIN